MWPIKFYRRLTKIAKWYNFAFVICFIQLTSCNIFDPQEDVPAFLEIDTILLSTNFGAEGTEFQSFSDAWVFVNNDLLGVFPVPSRLPVFATGDATVLILPGIKNNNRTDNRAIYPLIENDTTFVNFTAGETVNISPEVNYRTSAEFKLLSDFDVTNDFTLTSGYLQLQTTDDPAEVFEGTRSLKLKLDTLNNNFAIRTFEDYTLPSFGEDAYIEMHYKNEAAFTVLLAANFNNDPSINGAVLNIGPQNEWTKIYIPIGEIIASAGADSYTLNFEGILPDTLESATYYWDNIKILHN